MFSCVVFGTVPAGQEATEGGGEPSKLRKRARSPVENACSTAGDFPPSPCGDVPSKSTNKHFSTLAELVLLHTSARHERAASNPST